MIDLPITGFDDEGYIHLPGGPLPVFLSYDEEGDLTFEIDEATAPPERIQELEKILAEHIEGWPDVMD